MCQKVRHGGFKTLGVAGTYFLFFKEMTCDIKENKSVSNYLGANKKKGHPKTFQRNEK